VSSDRFAFAPIRAKTLADEEYTPESTRRKVSHLTLLPVPRRSERSTGQAGDSTPGPGTGTRCHDVRFATEPMSFDQDGIGVIEVLQDRRTGTEHTPQRPTICLTAADGANSSISDDASASTYVDGPRVLYHTITAIVEADLTPCAAWPSGRHSVPTAAAAVHRPTGA
jgi:putative polyketide hydroxylase